MNEFINLVKDLRKAQIKYFRTRNYNDLNNAKRLEKEVDAKIIDLQTPQLECF
jgi:hypothetical protein